MKINLYVDEYFVCTLWQSKAEGSVSAAVPVAIKTGSKMSLRVVPEEDEDIDDFEFDGELSLMQLYHD